jgi:YbgC/YbaW family acyl-CoA thioester hydrolase
VSYEFRTKRRVEFAETDMAGIVHFAHFFRYMEMAEHEFLRSLGLSVHAEIDGRVISWPRVKAECSYRSPAEFEDVLDVHLMVREKTKRTVSYDFRFLKDEKLVATGSLTVVCVAMDPATRQMSSVAIPKMIDEKIEAAPAQLLRE